MNTLSPVSRAGARCATRLLVRSLLGILPAVIAFAYPPLVRGLTIFDANPELYTFHRGENLPTLPVIGPDGAIYGACSSGGKTSNGIGLGLNGSGFIYRLENVGSLNPTLNNLADFGLGGSDGGAPSKPVFGPDGNLYGVTAFGGYYGQHTDGKLQIIGAYGGGTFYRLTPDGKFTTLSRFTNATGHGFQETEPSLLASPDGNFYGVTTENGLVAGLIFRASPDGTITTLHSLDPSTEGSQPGLLVQGPDGNFYGVTKNEGPGGAGTFYRVTPGGDFNVLHAFNGDSEPRPGASIAVGADGNFYGLTGLGFGTIFRLTPAGGYTEVYRFSGQEDGAYPVSLTLGGDGNFYGCTSSSLFKFEPAGILTILGGANQPTGLTPAPNGKFYGVTTAGSLNDRGGLFQYKVQGLAEANLVTAGVNAAHLSRAANESATVTFTRLGDASGKLRVRYKIGGGLEPGVDYAPLSGKVRFLPGSTTATATISALAAGHNGKLKLTLVQGKDYQVGVASKVRIKLND